MMHPIMMSDKQVDNTWVLHPSEPLYKDGLRQVKIKKCSSMKRVIYKWSIKFEVTKQTWRGNWYFTDQTGDEYRCNTKDINSTKHSIDYNSKKPAIVGVRFKWIP